MNTTAGLHYFYKKRPYSGPLALILSICLHILAFLLIAYLIKVVPIKTVTAENEPESVQVTLNPPEVQKPQQKDQIKKPTQHKTLVTENPRSPAIVPPSQDKPVDVPEKSHGLEKFLPSSSPQFLNRLRQQARNPKDIQADGGDIPMQGQERRRDIPMVVDRFEHKDMSLYQFSKMFHDRFGAVWNSEERIVPPSSPLRPGDVVYYKVFINPNGTLDHFENLTNKINPSLNTEALDKVFEEVIQNTLPMELPARLEKNVQVTEVIAIQVVNKTLFMNFG